MIVFIYPGYENLGIEYLSSSLKKEGFKTKLIFDPMLFMESGGPNIKLLGNLFNYKKKILKKIIKLKPKIICFSVTTDNYPWALNLTKEIKKNKEIPKTKILFGGPHPTALPEEVIKEESIDAICIGEGEEAIVEFAKNKKHGTKIQNIWEKENGKIIKSNLRPPIKNIDKIPFPDKDLFYKEFPLMKQNYSITTSRGCPYQCTFCNNSTLKKLYKQHSYFRRRTVKNTIEELKIAIKKYPIEFIRFEDELFTFDKSWLKEFIKEYKKEIGKPFFCTAHPNHISKEIIKLLKQGNCIEIQIGVESYYPSTREKVKRYYTNEQIKKAIANTKKEKITITTNNIFGLPGQTKKELEDLTKFYSRNMPSIINIFWLKRYPGTEISKGLKQKNYKGYVRGGDSFRIDFAKYQTILSLFHFLPKKGRLWLLKNKKIVPNISPMILTIGIRIFKKAKYDLRRTRIIQRYLYYSIKKIL